MSSVLIIGDTMRNPEMRHEVPIGIPDPFLYAELDGRRIVAISSMEAIRVEGLGTGLEVHTFEEYGADELRRTQRDRHSFTRELMVRAVKGLGIEKASVPGKFPVLHGDAIREAGVELVVDQKHFDDRRRRKSGHELEGIRRAQKAAEAGVATARELLARADRSNGVLKLDGKPLTCELLKEHVQVTFLAHGAIAEEMILSHGAQTAVGHDMGSGQIGADDVVMLDLFPVDLESGCFADLTRTVAFGEIPEELETWYALCREVMDLVSVEVRPGAHGSDLHRLVSEFFSDRGYPTILTKPDGEVLTDGFYHGLGHGVGLEVHEAPSLGIIGEELVAGDVITLEPGLYRQGFGGVRVEDLLLVTEDGYERLTDCPYELELGA
jgi:Xaa-Pro aminopeptidase